VSIMCIYLLYIYIYIHILFRCLKIRCLSQWCSSKWFSFHRLGIRWLSPCLPSISTHVSQHTCRFVWACMGTRYMDSLRGSSVNIGMDAEKISMALRKDDTHKSRGVKWVHCTCMCVCVSIQRAACGRFLGGRRGELLRPLGRSRRVSRFDSCCPTPLCIGLLCETRKLGAKPQRVYFWVGTG
jgi:hypothetical protein